jgi:hypothetical protein
MARVEDDGTLVRGVARADGTWEGENGNVPEVSHTKVSAAMVAQGRRLGHVVKLNNKHAGASSKCANTPVVGRAEYMQWEGRYNTVHEPARAEVEAALKRTRVSGQRLLFTNKTPPHDIKPLR